jgi:hypothetical protein
LSLHFQKPKKRAHHVKELFVAIEGTYDDKHYQQ